MEKVLNNQNLRFQGKAFLAVSIYLSYFIHTFLKGLIDM